ncbi:hypothetical protein QQS21_012468 [Conoideocrella luteorostrata]|uniref:Carbohydrate-binding module family 19 domain-containing protein n=1 Tax=Conoideocrella luteorostrata TaxID=1105319 RepID=A0AAJ0FSF5_9HYPO|nr:hypothetical protein QQS21_012468 [Conoideocrella luteorostrata]
MRFSVCSAAAAYFFLVTLSVEAGPLKWGADIVRRADTAPPGNAPLTSGYENTSEDTYPILYQDTDVIQSSSRVEATAPGPIFSTLTGTALGIAESLTATTTTVKADPAGFYSGPLSLIPVPEPTMSTTARNAETGPPGRSTAAATGTHNAIASSLSSGAASTAATGTDASTAVTTASHSAPTVTLPTTAISTSTTSTIAIPGTSTVSTTIIEISSTILSTNLSTTSSVITGLSTTTASSSVPDPTTANQPITVTTTTPATTIVVSTSSQATIASVVPTTTGGSSVLTSSGVSIPTTGPTDQTSSISATFTSVLSTGLDSNPTTASSTSLPTNFGTGSTTSATVSIQHPFSLNTTRTAQPTTDRNGVPSNIPVGSAPTSTQSFISGGSQLSTTQSSVVSTIVTTAPTVTIPETAITSIPSQTGGNPVVVLPGTQTTLSTSSTLPTISVSLTEPTLTLPQATTTLTATTLPPPAVITTITTSSSLSSSATGTTSVATFAPTGKPDSNVPTANTNYPTATTTVAANIYASNLAEAKSLNKMYSSLSPQSACDRTQTACIEGKTAQCDNGRFTLDECPAGQKCYALPMTNSQGAKINCIDPAEATKILGPGSAGESSTRSSLTDVPPTTFRTETRPPTLTHTRVVTVTYDSSTATTSSLMPPPPEPTSTIITTQLEVRPTSTVELPPPSPPPPSARTSSQPSRIIITQTFNQPTNAPTSSQPVKTTGVVPTPDPSSLVLIPIDLPTTSAAAPATTSAPAAAAKPAASDRVLGGPEAGNPRTTIFNNGTPTVSVYFTVTVTQKETETVTATLIAPA